MISNDMRQERIDSELHRRAEMRDFARRHGEWLLTERELRDVLDLAARRAQARRFTGAALTGFGELS